MSSFRPNIQQFISGSDTLPVSGRILYIWPDIRVIPRAAQTVSLHFKAHSKKTKNIILKMASAFEKSNGCLYLPVPIPDNYNYFVKLPFL